MSKIKDAIIKGEYPVKKIYVHPKVTDEYLMQNLTATLPDWQKEQELKKQLEVDKLDDWNDNHIKDVDYGYQGGGLNYTNY